MNEPNMDETMRALAGAGILDGAGDPAAYGDDDAIYAAATPEAADTEAGEPASGLDLTGLLGSSGSMIAAAFVGSKLSGRKSSGNVVADVVTTVTEKIGEDGKKTTTSGGSGKKGVLETIKSVPDAIAAPLGNSVQAMLEEFAASSGSGSIVNEFAQAMQDISQKDKAGGDRVLPSIGNVLPDAVKSVESFIPGL